MLTPFRRWVVEHEATDLGNLLREADGEGAIGVDVTLSSDKKLGESTNI